MVVILKPTAQRIEQVLRHQERNRTLLNQMFKSLYAETAHIDLAFAVDDLLRKRLPIAAECLNPWPEQGDAIMMRSLSG